MTKALGENLIPAIKAKIEASKVKLYDDFGSATDGALTQKTISEKLDQSVQRDTSASADTTTVKLKVTTGNIKLNTSVDKDVPLPVASETQAGVINTSTYKSIQETAEKVETLLGAIVSIADLPEEPTQIELTEAWKTATGKDALVNGAKIDDSTNNKTWTYYSNIDEWKESAAGATTVTVSGFTNTAAGTILGSTEKFRVHAEADFTGSVNGLIELEEKVDNSVSDLTDLTDKLDAEIKDREDADNALQTQVTANTTSITNLNLTKQDTLVDSGDQQNIKTINSQSLLGTGNLEIEVPEYLTAEEFETAWAEA